MKKAKPRTLTPTCSRPKRNTAQAERAARDRQKTPPDAEERLSYDMPYYAWNGRLAYFSIWKEHIGLYVPTPVIEEHAAELAGYETNKATVRLPLRKKLPVALIRKLITARLEKNAAKGKSTSEEEGCG